MSFLNPNVTSYNILNEAQIFKCEENQMIFIDSTIESVAPRQDDISENSTIIFDISGNQSYIDLKHSFLQFDIIIQKANGSQIVAQDKVYIQSDTINSIISELQVSLNEEVVVDLPILAYITLFMNNYSTHFPSALMSGFFLVIMLLKTY